MSAKKIATIDKPNTTMAATIKAFAESLHELGPLVETRLLYQSPTSKGKLRTPITVEVHRGREWFFAAVPELEILEEGETPDAAVKHCLETLFEIMDSYANTPLQDLSEDARAHWKRLKTVAELTKVNGRHSKK
ncbi:hypothetical protein HYR54_00885 [Candidatus Acetothermia bacterium]|nr:hypothetical protein [Candidatus Acetothermia bacterium]